MNRPTALARCSSGIYIARDETGLVKIGSTTRLRQRVKDLDAEARTDGRGGITLLHWFACRRGRYVEQEVHWRLARYRTTKRVNGGRHRPREWYELTPEIIRQLPRFLRRTWTDCHRPPGKRYWR